MKDEIKEILEYVLSLTYGNENAIKGINKVEDYITNLQERNEKAIEYINNNIKNREGLTVEEYKIKWRMMLDYYESQEIMEDLLNILQGEDKE